ncbi:class I SAM-dependent methyltransferase [Candidatus Sumerlaeota bacterium]|nr:class I SAM-dependent methyltransferase [Candidatus Sumerlaeota bacterium]
MLQAIKRVLKRGVRIPFSDFRVRVERDNSPPRHRTTHRVLLNRIRFLMDRVPELREFDHPCFDEDQEYAELFLRFADDFIPTVRECMDETQRRRLLHWLRSAVKHDGYRRQLDRLVQASALRCGVLDERTWGALKEMEENGNSPEDIARLRRAVEEHERNFESRTPHVEFIHRTRDRIYEQRDRALTIYFQERTDLIAGKRVVHFAPEKTLGRWLHENAKALRMDYVTADPFMRRIGRREDVQELSLSDCSVDFVICHHVFDVVPDDARAMREIARVLKPHGILHASCHESMQNESAIEWLVEDTSLHSYLRHYGRDLSKRLNQAGFEVTVDRTFLDMSPGEHLRQGTMPLRIYFCRKHGHREPTANA